MATCSIRMLQESKDHWLRYSTVRSDNQAIVSCPCPWECGLKHCAIASRRTNQLPWKGKDMG
eukprot:2454747-Amphidinium_carterae.2